MQSKADYGLFTKHDANTITLVLAYVDDLRIAGNSESEIDKLKHMLSIHFHMKDLGSLRYFLGLEIDKSDQGFFVSQKKYTLDLLKEFDMHTASPLKVPLDVHLKLTPEKGNSLSDPTQYQKAAVFDNYKTRHFLFSSLVDSISVTSQYCTYASDKKIVEISS